MHLDRDLLHAIATKGRSAVASAIGKDDSTVSRITSGQQGVQFSDIEAFLAACGFKAVPQSAVVVDREELEHLCRVAQRHYAKRARDLMGEQ